MMLSPEIVACRRVHSRLVAEQNRLTLCLARVGLTVPQILAFSETMQRLQRAALLAERPATIAEGLQLLEPGLRAELRAMLPDANNGAGR